MPQDSETLAGEDLTGFFQARDIALVGASDKSEWSKLIHSRFERFGHEGSLLAVNRNGNMAHGLPGFKSCTEADLPIDMAYIYVPATAVTEALRDAAAAGIRRAVILTSGFAEAGPEGAAMQDDVAAVARELGIRLMGPNSMGYANIAHRSAVTSINSRLPVRAGSLALVSQSGAIANELGKFAHTQAIGLSFLAATGNEADIGLADIVEYLVNDDAVKAIGIYAESINNPARFAAAAAKARAARKPIVLLKLGRSEMSAAIAQAHTGSLLGDDGIFDAMCQRYAITRVYSIEELIITANVLARVGPIYPARIGMLSISGGACAMYADLASIYGLDVPQWSEPTQAKLREVLPSFAATLNPLDVTGAVVQTPEIWTDAIRAVCEDPNIGMVLVVTLLPNTPTEVALLGDGIRPIGKAFRTAGRVPMVANTTVQDVSEARLEFMRDAGIDPILPNLDIGVRALAHLQRWSERLALEMPTGQAVVAAGTQPQGERETLAYLAERGVPVIKSVLVADAEAAGRAAASIGGPAALKIASPDIAHKTEAGGVRLNVAATDAARVFEEIIASVKNHAPAAAIDGVLVSPMRGAGTELIVGIVRDPEWGLAVSAGLGGVLTEILEDRAIRLAPLDAAAVRAMLMALRGARLLQGFRGQPAADLDRLSEVIVAIAQAAEALGPNLAVLEINPLRVHGAEIEALDALAVYQA